MATIPFIVVHACVYADVSYRERERERDDVHLEQNGDVVWRDQSGEQDVRRALALDDQAAQLQVGLRACGRDVRRSRSRSRRKQ